MINLTAQLFSSRYPGPIPGMRPPMGAGSHQATKSANSMGFIMPLYTIGIVSFFIYTIMKLIFKKTPATPYTEVKPDPVFRNEVFTTEQYIKRPDDGTTKLDQPNATAASNGEPLVVPVSVSPISNAVPAAEPPSSVQSELTIDYEQLSKQKEAAKPDENAVAEPLVVPVNVSAISNASPTSEPASSVESELTIDYEQLPKQEEVTKPNENAVAERIALDEEAASGETILQDKTSEPTETVSEEGAQEDFEHQPSHDPTTEKVVDGIVVQKVVLVEESTDLSPQPVVDEDEKHELGIDNAVAEEHRDNAQTQERELIAEPVTEEVMVMQQVPVQNATMAPSKEDELITTEQIDGSEIAEEPTPVTETKQSEETSMFEMKENVQNEIEQTDKLEEPITEIAVQQDGQEEVLENAPSVEFSNDAELPVVEPSIAQETETETAHTATPLDVPEQKQSEAEYTITQRTDSNVKEVSFDDSISTQENEQIDNVIEQEAADLQVEAELTKEKEEIVSEDISSVDTVAEVNELQQVVEEIVAEPTMARQLEESVTNKVLDSETSLLVHETVEEITLTAEQLVQEVLEQAEQLAKQQDTKFPDLPAYDPATQKLVDGIVVEKFDQLAAKPSEATDEPTTQEESKEQETVPEEQTVEELELAVTVEQAVIEEDAGEMDSISEDTSLSVASVIEQQPKMKESEESNTVSDVLKTSDEMTDSASSEVAFFESKDQSVNQNVLEPEVVPEEQLEVNDPGNKFGAAVADSFQVDAVIVEQPAAKEAEAEQATLPEALITTEVMTGSTSSEPVFVELNDQPTVEVETVLEGSDKVDEAGNQSDVAAADSNDSKSVSIEEVLDEAAIVDEVEGKVIEEHIIPITIEKASTSDTMTITEVTGDDAIVESPNVSKTMSNLPSPLITAVPLMDTIDEKQEAAEVMHEKLTEQEKHSEISLTTLEHVTKEALVERTLNEAAAVVNEIESIVDHIITEKLIHSGASDAIATTNGVLESSPQEPPRLAASAALIVEAIESQSSGVHSMVSNSDSTLNKQTITVINELSTNLDEPIGDTNLPASDSLPIVSPSLAPASTPSSEAFPVPESTPFSPSAIVPNGVSETQSINFVADEQRTYVAAGQGSADVVQRNTTTIEKRVAVDEPEGGSTTTTTIGQVPTSVSNVTNPKFLTLNLANYSTSNSSGNNSKSSSLSIANFSQSGSSLAGGDSADQLMELELLRKKLDETERAMTKIIANMGNIPKGQVS
uniref:Resistance to inhibitors of cholinesterase protein 3 N-terminal domain-containing protein n=1 Tax=Anopheles christyi TaxID=43041 RepID=A0A182K334_9DIPT